MKWLSLGILALLALSSTGCLTVNLFGGARGSLRETVVAGKSGPKILMIEVDGVIIDRPEETFVGAGREGTVARLREQLDRARQDDQIKAILLRIDSPGGTASASEMAYQEIVRFKEERGIPIVAQFMGTATSGGYYIAMAADLIVAQPTTVTGSIGVIFVNVNVSGLMAKIGIKDETITGGEYKDAGSPLRPMRPEERAHLKAVIEDLLDRFRTVVDKGRPKLTREQVNTLADGRIYSAPQARDNGLVDRIGSLEDSVSMIEKRVEEPEMRVVTYHRRREYRKNLYTQGPQPPVLKLELPSVLGRSVEPGFHYLWWPGH